MSIIIDQYLCEPGKVVCEDLVSFDNKSFAMVLDGSTGLIENNSFIDAKWYVDKFSQSMIEQVPSNCGLKDVVRRCILHMQKEYSKIYGLQDCKGMKDTIEMPSASLMVIREHDDKIELLSLGDCTALVEYRDVNKSIDEIHDNTVSRLDKSVIKKVIELSIENSTSILDTAAMPVIRKMLIENRMKKNKQDGYWILGFQEEAVDYGIYREYNKEEIKRIIMFSDGFADYYNSTGLAADCFDFYEQLRNANLNDLYKLLRKEEEKDSQCSVYPRLKVKDDASIVIADINAN